MELCSSIEHKLFKKRKKIIANKKLWRIFVFILSVFPFLFPPFARISVIHK